MKKTVLVSAALLAGSVLADPFTAMTYNTRFHVDKDGPENTWAKREPRIVQVVRDAKADLVGFQEITKDSYPTLVAALPEYEFADGPAKHGPTPIAFRPELFERLDSGRFFLSERPNDPKCNSWGSSGPRVCQWALLKFRATGRKLRVFCQHPDWKSGEQRAKGMALVMDKAKAAMADGELVIVLGDMNDAENESFKWSPCDPLYPTGESIRVARRVLNDTFEISETPHTGTVDTAQGFKPEYHGRIDYIFTCPEFRVLAHRTHNDRPGGGYPSDHDPVSARLDLIDASDAVRIGWAEEDLTPPATKRIPLDGQYYQRLADEKNLIHTRLKFVAVAIQRGKDHFLTASIDNECVWGPWQDRVRARVHELVPEIDPGSIFINCIHTHCAPAIRHSGTPAGAEAEKRQPHVWGPNEYADFALERAAKAFVDAWKARKPGGIQRAFGRAEVGHCRLSLYRDRKGVLTGQMYGDTTRPDFIGMEEGEDDGVEMLFTTDLRGDRTGLILNAACPAQVMEATYQVSSDFAGVTRERLKRLYGKDFHMIYEIGAGGDQSPRDLVRGPRYGVDGWHADACEAIANRLVGAVLASVPHGTELAPVVKHEKFVVDVPLRTVTASEVAAAKKALAALDAKTSRDREWRRFLDTVKKNEAKGGAGPYDDKELDFINYEINRAIVRRAKEQVETPTLPVEMHVVRVGDAAFATCPVELYLAYGQSIKARSAARQTFVVEQCGGTYGYVPTSVSESVRGYGGGVNNGKFGHEGGFRMCDAAVKGIARLFGRR